MIVYETSAWTEREQPWLGRRRPDAGAPAPRLAVGDQDAPSSCRVVPDVREQFIDGSLRARPDPPGSEHAAGGDRACLVPPLPSAVVGREHLAQPRRRSRRTAAASARQISGVRDVSRDLVTFGSPWACQPFDGAPRMPDARAAKWLRIRCVARTRVRARAKRYTTQSCWIGIGRRGVSRSSTEHRAAHFQVGMVNVLTGASSNQRWVTHLSRV